MNKKTKKFLISALAALFVISVLFFLYKNFPRRLNQPAPPGGSAGQEAANPVVAYKNDRFGYAINYPSGWVLEAPDKNSETVNFSNPKNFSEEFSITVVSARLKKVIDDTFAHSSKGPVMGGLESTGGEIAEKDSPSPLKIVYVIKGDNLYYVSGRTEYFDEIVKSFSFASN